MGEDAATVGSGPGSCIPVALLTAQQAVSASRIDEDLAVQRVAPAEMVTASASHSTPVMVVPPM